ncbi:MAG: DnaJ C-terminal domain-containing protein [Methylovulum sp.]|nr:DnaJ C-terminal domain-containing protein [Methylovulum sp.]
MKYKDYYSIFGIARNASAAEIKAAYRKLAHKYHPDVSKEPDAEEKFKEISEAYKTLKDPEKRAAYDQLGRYQSGQEFKPPPDWQQQYSETHFSFDDIDLSDLFAGLRGKQQHTKRDSRKIPIPGQDYEVTVHISLEEAYSGAEVELDLNMPEYDENGFARRVPHTFKTRIPKGATDGQRLRVPGKGGKGFNGGPPGDLYINIVLRPHSLYRPSGHDLYLDLPVAPWEAVLGATIEVPTPGGSVRLKIPAGTHAGQHLRLPKRGLPKPHTGEGDLFAIVQIAVPSVISERERQLYKQLAEGSAFNPRGHFEQEGHHES